MSTNAASHVADHHTPTTAKEWRRVTEGLTRRFSGDFPYLRIPMIPATLSNLIAAIIPI